VTSLQAELLHLRSAPLPAGSFNLKTRTLFNSQTHDCSCRPQIRDPAQRPAHLQKIRDHTAATWRRARRALRSLTPAQLAEVTREQLRAYAIEEFRRHWRTLAASGQSSEKWIWRAAWKFQTSKEEDRRRLARHFYGGEHVRRMAALSNAQIEKRLSCYLPRAVAYATQECITRREQRKFLKDLVTNIYVMYHSEQCGWSDAYDENWPNLVHFKSSQPSALL
jgi:hypothetical protein